MSAVTGAEFKGIEGSIKDVGSYLITIQYLLPYAMIETKDPYIDFKLPIEIESEGLIDFCIFDSMLKKYLKKVL